MPAVSERPPSTHLHINVVLEYSSSSGGSGGGLAPPRLIANFMASYVVPHKHDTSTATQTQNTEMSFGSANILRQSSEKIEVPLTPNYIRPSV